MTMEKAYYWPRWFATSYSGNRMPAASLTKLSWANACLWRALNIYDDFLDGGGRPAKLSLANKYYRQFLKIYYELRLPEEFYKLFHRILDGLDAANRQEAAEMGRGRLTVKANGEIKFRDGRINGQAVRLTDDLSGKSLALALGPIAYLYIQEKPSGLKPRDRHRLQKTVDGTLRLFRLMLTAKQLADDSRDWLDDLKAGRITAANILVLRAAERHGYNLNWRTDPELLYLLFSAKASKTLTDRLDRLCVQSETAAAALGLKRDSALLRGILGPIRIGIEESRHFREQWPKIAEKML